MKLFPAFRPPAARRGSLLVWFAVASLVLVGLVGLALDTARVFYAGQQLQAAADAAALSGARLVAGDDPATDFAATRQAALDVAQANPCAGDPVMLGANAGNDPAGEVVVGTWDAGTRTFTPTTSEPDAVRVTARREASSLGGSVPLVFGPLLGVADAGISRTATARLGAKAPAALLVLHPTRQNALEIKGNAQMKAVASEIQVNSTAPCALHLNGQPGVIRLEGAKVEVVGGACFPSGSVFPTPVTGVDPDPDPYAHIPWPDASGMPDRGAITGPGNYLPGYYSGGMSFNGGTAVLQSGLYVFGPPGIKLNGSAHVDGDEVALFLEPGASLTTAGTGAGLRIGPPTAGTYEGMSVFQHRSSTLTVDISGLGLFEVGGAMYLASGHLEMDGNVDREIGSIVVSTLLVRGNARYTITGIGPPPAGSLYSYLVD